MSDAVVIIGGSHGGAQVAARLREGGFGNRIILVSDEPCAPYHRPPLSKAYLKDPSGGLPYLRGDDFYAQNDIDLRLGERAISIDPAQKEVALASGSQIAYGHLVLATGARVRKPDLPGADAKGVYYLRTAGDSDMFRAALTQGQKLVVVGGGFIGLEAAATARSLGCSVTVIEAADKVMGRAVAPQISAYFLAAHRASGIDIKLATGLASIETNDKDEAVAVHSSAGERMPADAVLIGIGVLPNMELAQEAGLTCGNGVFVGPDLRSSDPSIFAIGDVAFFPVAKTGSRLRLESVQAATDHARHVAKEILGEHGTYDEVPWFWSDQADLKLQMVGLGIGADDYVLRGDPAAGKFSVAHVKEGEIIAVDSVNAPADHMVFRKLLAGQSTPTADQFGDINFDLRAFMRAQR